MKIKIRDSYLEIIRSDITKLKIDAIVNPANCKLKMTKGLAAAIKKRAGDSVEKLAKRKAPAKTGNAVWTTAGKLKAKYIIHAVTTSANSGTDEKKIRAACANALLCAQRLKLKSIAFPALGCGIGSFPVMGSAKIMTQEVLRYLRENKKTLRRIVFCVFDEKAFGIFKKSVLGYTNHLLNKLSQGPYMTADAIIEYRRGIVLIERSNPPYGWALPGGFIEYGESLEKAVVREVKEETNLKLVNIRQLHTYSKPGRDPRFHTVTTVFVGQGRGRLSFGDDAQGAGNRSGERVGPRLSRSVFRIR